MAIPLSALRRALAEMAAEAGSGARSAYNNEHIVRGYLGGAGGGAVLGGAGGAFIDSPIDGANMGPAGAVTGLAAGALLGATGGGGAKLAHMVINAAREGGRGFSGGLREALAEQAASRGVGRRAVREAADAGDAAAFAGVDRGLERRLAAFPPRVQELARAIAPIKAEKGSVGWDDLDKIQSELGSITPDELLDLRIIFSDGLSVTRVGHP